MSMADVADDQKKYKGARRRKWGKWVSEIRVPATKEKLWLGTYSTPEAAAVAHDVAFYCLRRPESLDRLNFPMMVPVGKLSNDMSPQSVQRVASDAGMAVDALMVVKKLPENKKEAEESGGAHSGFEPEVWGDNDQSFGAWTRGEKELSISVDDYLTRY
ncbi:hypothetical protein Dsin_014859 [Dipteronia sinensis]|uniref:AP2/ERF domain-containing protein n=1 Tax=Dipteronia sinensis TaxID=43782 RepID=A0AAE0ANV2_9ROSI|nr:hypothetical protein Dsin_014859 [Dipteronia sinensis]